MHIACQKCGQAPATVHLTDLLKNEKRELHLCGTCAEDEGIVMKSQQAPLNEMLTKFVMNKQNVKDLADLTCDECGMTFVEFRSNGLLGCPNDYDAFKRALEPLIERSHEGSIQHCGKMTEAAPAETQARASLVRMRRELQSAVDNEDYEQAARLRDEIENLESI